MADPAVKAGPVGLLSVMSKRGGGEALPALPAEPVEAAEPEDVAEPDDVPEAQSLVAADVRNAIRSGSDDDVARALKRFFRVTRLLED